MVKGTKMKLPKQKEVDKYPESAKRIIRFLLGRIRELEFENKKLQRRIEFGDDLE